MTRLFALSLLAALLAAGCTTLEQAEASFEERLEDWNQCEADAECTVIFPGCPFGCAVAVNEAHAEEAQAYAADLSAALERSGQVCMYGCVAPGEPFCEEGRCRVEEAAPEQNGAGDGTEDQSEGEP